MNKKSISMCKGIAFILAVVILSFLVGYLISRAWTEPTASPPDANVSAPINVGPEAQVKEGSPGTIAAGGFLGQVPGYGLYPDPGAASTIGSSLTITGSYLKLPNLSTTQRNSLNLTGAGYGHLIYNYTDATLEGYGPSGWTVLAEFVTLGLGQGCTYGTDCTSGHCADGVCCNSACNDKVCQTCGSSSSAGNGNCGYITSGDPDNECTQNCSGIGYTCGCTVAGDCGGAFPYCADGVCCDTACTGEYEVCNYEGRGGTCLSEPGGACSSDGACTSGICGTDADDDGYFSQNLGHTGICQATSKPYTDCYDANPDAKPGQSNYFTAHRGDGSFDYNCDGTEDKRSQYCDVLTSCSISGDCTLCTGYNYRYLTASGTINGRTCGETFRATCRDWYKSKSDCSEQTSGVLYYVTTVDHCISDKYGIETTGGVWLDTTTYSRTCQCR